MNALLKGETVSRPSYPLSPLYQEEGQVTLHQPHHKYCKHGRGAFIYNQFPTRCVLYLSTHICITPCKNRAKSSTEKCGKPFSKPTFNLTVSLRGITCVEVSSSLRLCYIMFLLLELARCNSICNQGDYNQGKHHEQVLPFKDPLLMLNSSN